MKFGKLQFTKEVSDTIDKDIEFSKFIVKSLERYGMNDWGNLDEKDKEINDLSVKRNNGRVISKYRYHEKDIYIITDIQCQTTVTVCDE